MSWSLIVGAVVIAVLIISALWLVNRNIEAARERRRQKINALNRRAGSFLDLLDSVPMHYLGKLMSQYALEQVQQSMQELTQLEPANQRAFKLLEQSQQQLAQLTQSGAPPAHKITSQQEAQDIRRALISAARFVQSLNSSGHMETGRARQLLNHLKLMASQVSVDALMFKADEARREGKAPMALLLYQRALDELSHLPPSPYHTQMTSRIEGIMQELGKVSTASAFDKPKAAQDEVHSLLEEQFDASLKEEQSWKKKAY